MNVNEIVVSKVSYKISYKISYKVSFGKNGFKYFNGYKESKTN